MARGNAEKWILCCRARTDYQQCYDTRGNFQTTKKFQDSLNQKLIVENIEKNLVYVSRKMCPGFGKWERRNPIWADSPLGQCCRNSPEWHNSKSERSRLGCHSHLGVHPRENERKLSEKISIFAWQLTIFYIGREDKILEGKYWNKSELN